MVQGWSTRHHRSSKGTCASLIGCASAFPWLVHRRRGLTDTQLFGGIAGSPEGPPLGLLTGHTRDFHTSSRERHHQRFYISRHQILIPSFHWMASIGRMAAAALMETTEKPVLAVGSVRCNHDHAFATPSVTQSGPVHGSYRPSAVISQRAFALSRAHGERRRTWM